MLLYAAMGANMSYSSGAETVVLFLLTPNIAEDLKITKHV